MIVLLLLIYFFLGITLTVISSYRLTVFPAIPLRSAKGSALLSSSASSSSSDEAVSIGAESKRGKSQVGNIEVYSTVGCKYCRIAKAKLLELGLTDWVDINVNVYDSIQSQESLSSISRERLLHARQNTVPQIYVGLHRVGGCDDLLAAVEDGSFLSLLIGLDKNRYGNIIVTNTVTAEPTKSSTSPSNQSEPLLHLSRGGASSLNEPILGFDHPEDEMMRVVANRNGTTASLVSVGELSKKLQLAALSLTDSFVSPDGKQVNYNTMRHSTEFREFVSLTAQLRLCSIRDLCELEDRHKIALFSNIYNAMIIHATCVLGSPADSPAARAEFFSGRSGATYIIGTEGLSFSPDDIEHGILRGNLPHPSSNRNFFLDLSDERAKIAIDRKSFDPRIHFILNCGASSCPPIKVLSPENLEEALSSAAAGYLAAEVKVDVEEKTIRLPKLLLWYGSDFGGDVGQVLRAISPMMMAPTTTLTSTPTATSSSSTWPSSSAGTTMTLAGLLASDQSPLLSEFKVAYSDYDWSLNESKADR